jgi:hypothetical protein
MAWFKTFLVLFLLLFFVTNAFAGLTDDLEAYYDFVGDATDKSGNNNDLNVDGDHATLTTDRFGNSNSAYLLDDVDSRFKIYLDDSHYLSWLEDGAFTGVISFKSNAVPSNIAPIVSHYNWKLTQKPSGEVRFVTGRMNEYGGDFYLVESTAAISQDTFYNASFVYSPDLGSSGTIYDDAINYYPFSGNAEDQKGVNDGTVNGATLTTGIWGTAQSAYALGGDNYITPDSQISLTEGKSISFWIKPRVASHGYGNDFYNGYYPVAGLSTNHNDSCIDLKTQYIRIQDVAGSFYDSDNFSVPFDNDTWYHYQKEQKNYHLNNNFKLNLEFLFFDFLNQYNFH